jgi:The GLUG motif.
MGLQGGGFVGTAQAQTNSEPTDVNASDLIGDGTDSNPYEISNVSDLQAMEDDLDANYELVSDIDASSTAQWNDGRGFHPVGSAGNEFTGVFDGNDHTITGLTIDRPNERNVGLFERSSGTVTDITLIQVTVTGKYTVGSVVGYNTDGTIQNVSASGSITGDTHVGGLVGQNIFGTIQTASASGNVERTRTAGGLVENTFPGEIQDASTSGSVGDTGGVGGLVGTNGFRGTIRVASASGNVSGGTRVGGLVGTNGIRGTIRVASASGNVSGSTRVGGLVGLNGGTVQSVSASGNVSGSTRVGGLVGFTPGGTIRNALVVGSVSGNSDMGGLIGGYPTTGPTGTVDHSYFDTQTTGQDSSAGSAVGLSTAELKGSAAAKNTNLAFGDTWRTVSGGYPELIAQSDSENGSLESDSENESFTSEPTTTSSKAPVFSDGGVILVSGMLIGISHRLHSSS